jgi:hypothetical protein
MNFVYIFTAFLLIYLFLQTHETTDGDSTYRGEPEPILIDRLRYLAYALVCNFAFFCAVVDAKVFPTAEEIVVVIAVVVIEGRFLIRKSRTEHATPRPVDQKAGVCIDEILALCEQYMRAGVKAQSFYIPRWLTRNEFFALRRKLMQKNFGVKYTFLSRFTNRPMLKMFPLNVWYE